MQFGDNINAKQRNSTKANLRQSQPMMFSSFTPKVVSEV